MAVSVSVGIVGTSRWADMLSLPSLKSHPEAALTAICGRNRSRAQEMAVKYDVPRVYTDYREMIDRAGLDALVVSAPDDLHHAITMAALEAGLHVLCEKPLASYAAQAREMYETAKARLLGFANGAQGLVQLSTVAHLAERGGEQGLLIHGEEGTLEAAVHVGGPDKGAVVRGVRQDEDAFRTLSVPDAFGGDLDLDGAIKRFNEQSLGPRAFIDAILEDRPAVPNFHDGLRAQEAIDAALASHRTGRWMAVSG